MAFDISAAAQRRRQESQTDTDQNKNQAAMTHLENLAGDLAIKIQDLVNELDIDSTEFQALAEHLTISFVGAYRELNSPPVPAGPATARDQKASDEPKESKVKSESNSGKAKTLKDRVVSKLKEIDQNSKVK